MKKYNFNTIPELLYHNKWLKKANEVENKLLNIRNQICQSFQKLEDEFSANRKLQTKKFKKKIWKRNKKINEFGGGVSSVLKGNLFEKVGVNISTVSGIFPNDYKRQIRGADDDPRFFATGISVVAHMRSPFIPAAHYNSRFIITKDAWFGGGCDLTPTFYENVIKKKFHTLLKDFCKQYDQNFYQNYSKWCSEYFFLKHRNEERGIGGIFYDYLDANIKKNLNFTMETGTFFLKTYYDFITKYQNKNWDLHHREKLFKKRSRYVEFNLLYDKGTTFGLKTNGNVDAILMSMPPIASWN